MKCFLHIGVEKTGTTALQHFLNLNRAILQSNGYFTPESVGLINHTSLAIAAYNPDRWDDMTVSMGMKKDVGDLARFQQKTIADLKKEIEKVASHGPETKIIFSSEHIQSRLTRLIEIQRLREILLNLGINEIKVIVYLRDPVGIANALFSTAIKSGHTIHHPPPPDNPYFNNICNHKNTLEKFGSIFGVGALIPRLFNKSDLKNGSIIEDFMNVAGIPPDSSYILPEIMNETLSAAGINIMRKINEIIPRIIDDRMNPQRADLVKYFEKYFSQSKYMMPEGIVKDYEMAFKESNEWVRSNYFPEKESLFPEKSYIRIPDYEMPEEIAANVAAIIADIWLNKQKGTK